MAHSTMMLLSVEEAATILDIAPRSVRRWLQEGQLVGRKIGTIWVVLLPREGEFPDTHKRSLLLHGREPIPLAMIRQQLRQLGSQLIAIGNAAAGAQHKRGEVFLTWRRPGGLQITFAMGRESPSQGWAPHALGMELPFWLKERQRWQRRQAAPAAIRAASKPVRPTVSPSPTDPGNCRGGVSSAPHCDRGMRNPGTPGGGASNTVHEPFMSQARARNRGSQPTTSILCAMHGAEA